MNRFYVTTWLRHHLSFTYPVLDPINFLILFLLSLSERSEVSTKVYGFQAKWCLRGVIVKAVFKNHMTVITFALAVYLEMPDADFFTPVTDLNHSDK